MRKFRSMVFKFLLKYMFQPERLQFIAMNNSSQPGLYHYLTKLKPFPWQAFDQILELQSLAEQWLFG